MPERKPSKNSIDPIALTAAALKAVRSAADYHRLGNTTEPAVLEAAWNKLPESEQQRLTDIVNTNAPADPQLIADELTACGTLIQLQAVKAHHGELLIKSAWRLLPPGERDRLTAICKNGTEPEPQPATEPAPAELKPKPKTLIELTADLQQLDAMLDAISGDIPPDVQQAVDELLHQRDQTHDQLMEKLDNYAALIQNRAYWAATRKAELERLSKLIESDQKAIDFLKGRLKAYLEATEKNKVRTKRFNISVKTAGGKQGLRLNVENPKDLPERFQRIIIEPDNTALREALEANDPEAKEAAHFAERTTYVAIN